MFHKLASMIKTVWVEELKEPVLAEKFFATYIDVPHYDTWHLGMVDLACCVPNNNANERSTLSLKGSRIEDALCSTGRDLGSMICKHFPQAIYHLSVFNVGVERCLDIDDKKSILNITKARFKEILRPYCERFDPEKDKKMSYYPSYRENGNGPVVYLVNRYEDLGTFISEDRENAHNDALAGKTPYSARDWKLYVRSANSLCKVTETTCSDGRKLYRGSCPQFMKWGWCSHSAVCAYESDLLKVARSIPSTRSNSGRTNTRKPVRDGSCGRDELKNTFRRECTAVKDKILCAHHIANETKDKRISDEVCKLIPISVALTGFIVSFTNKKTPKKTVENKNNLLWSASGFADNLIQHTKEVSVDKVKFDVSEIINAMNKIMK